MQPLRDADPRVVGRYLLLARLGAGAGGTTFLGRSPGNRAVAVKVVHSHLARNRDFRRRFQREVAAARAAGGLHTTHVIDSGWTTASAWLVTEYVPAPSLAQLIESAGPLPAPVVLALGRAIAEALSVIHAAGVVHRDLKPSNILVTATGPLVIDFGVAQLADDATATATILGTPGFLAPEQALGDSAGPAADVYSLGAVLVFAATGSGPFGEAEPATLLYRVVHEPPDLDGVPGGALRDAVAACLAREPAERPTPGELLTALPDSEFQLPPPIAALVATYARPLAGLPATPALSRRALLRGVAGALVLLPCVTFGMRAATRSEDHVPNGGAAPGGTTLSSSTARPRRIPLPSLLTATSLALSADERQLLVTGSRQHAVLDAASGNVLRTVTATEADHAAFSPDGRRIYAFRKGEDAVVYDGSTGDRLDVLPARDTSVGFVSADGTRLYLQSGKTVATYDTTTKTLVGQAIPVPRQISEVQISPDGKRLYAVEFSLMIDRENRISVLDLDAAAVAATIDVHGRARAVALSADGRRAAAITWNTTALSLIDTESGTVLGTTEIGARPAAVALSPDGTRAYVALELAAAVLSLDTTAHAVIDRTRVDRNPTALRITADGRHLYVLCVDDYTIDVIDLT